MCSLQLIKSNDIDAKLDFYRSKNRFLFTLYKHICTHCQSIRSIAKCSLFYRFECFTLGCIFHANFVNISFLCMCVRVCPRYSWRAKLCCQLLSFFVLYIYNYMYCIYRFYYISFFFVWFRYILHFYLPWLILPVFFWLSYLFFFFSLLCDQR